MNMKSKKKYRLGAPGIGSKGSWPKSQPSKVRGNHSTGAKTSVDVRKLKGQPIKVREIKHKPSGGFTSRMVTVGYHKYGMVKD